MRDMLVCVCMHICDCTLYSYGYGMFVVAVVATTEIYALECKTY